MQENRKNDWKIGDTYAYKIEQSISKDINLIGKYLIFRKVDEYKSNKIYESPIVYAQITNDNKLPKTKDEIENLQYIITANEGNVRHQYRMKLDNVQRKEKNDELIYLGNYINVITPSDEYIQKEKISIWSCAFKRNDYILDKLQRLGTNKYPIYYKTDPKNISDSYIRFLMKVEYYKNILRINPADKAIVKNDPLLYISLVDSLMIGGFVKNPVGFVNEEIKQETYKRIKELKNIINASHDEDKEKRIQVLDEFEKKVKEYTSAFFEMNGSIININLQDPKWKNIL